MEEESFAVIGFDEPPPLLVVELRDGAVQTPGGLGDPRRLEPRSAVVVRSLGDGLVLNRFADCEVAVALHLDHALVDEPRARPAARPPSPASEPLAAAE